jgi:hypothetical protein
MPDCRGRGAFAAYLEQIAQAPEPAVRAAGYDPAAYEKVIYLVPWRCADATGVAGSSRDIGLFGNRGLAARRTVPRPLGGLGETGLGRRAALGGAIAASAAALALPH